MLLAGCVVTAAPPQVAAKVAIILAAWMVPAGTYEAVIFTLVTPATPATGEAFNATCTWPKADWATTRHKTGSSAAPAINRVFMFLPFIPRMTARPTRPMANNIQVPGSGVPVVRSEEHTSELQSLR